MVVTCHVACLSLRRVRWMFRTRRFVGCYLRCHLGCWTLVLWLLPALLPASVCSGRVTVVDVVVVTCLMLPVFRCVACAGCCARAALLVVTCDVTWAAAPLSLLLLPVLLPACVCSGRVTVVAVVIVSCAVACLARHQRAHRSCLWR